MSTEDLFKDLAGTERALRELERARQEGPAGATPQCWPAWRILLARTQDPASLADWWARHGRSCPTCQDRERRVTLDLEASAGRAGRQVVRLLGRRAAEPGQELPAVGVPAAGYGPQAEAQRRVGLAEYHRFAGVAAASLDAVWCVAWEDALFLIVVGGPGALEPWRDGAPIAGPQGDLLGELGPASPSQAEALAPGGRLEGQPALCLAASVTIAELKAAEAFTVAGLLSGSIELGEETGAPSPARKLAADLSESDSLGPLVSDFDRLAVTPGEALTLSFTLRAFLRQGRLSEADRVRLQAIAWLPDDLRQALRSPFEDR